MKKLPHIFLFVIGTVLFLPQIALAEWSGLDYGQGSFNEEPRDDITFSDEEALRTEFYNQRNVTETESIDNQLDQAIQQQVKNTPAPYVPNLPSAVLDSENKLAGTVCKNEYYTGRGILVDISEQRAKLYEPQEINGELTCKLMETFRVTTGKDGKNTPIGKFHLAAMERHTVAGYSIDWMTFKNSGNEFWGIHPGPWQKSGFGDPNKRPKNGSLGCIRFVPSEWDNELKPLLFTGIFLETQL